MSQDHLAVRDCLTVLVLRVSPPLYTHRGKNPDSRRLLLESVPLGCDRVHPQGERKGKTDLLCYLSSAIVDRMKSLKDFRSQ